MKGLVCPNAQAKLTIATAAVPTSGVLHVRLIEPSLAMPRYDAVAGLDVFMLNAQGWVGEPGRQLQYEFRALQVMLWKQLMVLEAAWHAQRSAWLWQPIFVLLPLHLETCAKSSQPTAKLHDLSYTQASCFLSIKCVCLVVRSQLAAHHAVEEM